jgi:AcrR family transcriptional regulator
VNTVKNNGPDKASASNALPISRREAGKQERRRRIIEAARDLIRETGNAGLSMRALAARAGVSLATPYNLFGSKQAIILAVLEDVREYRQRFAALRTVGPLERIFMALDLALQYYMDDPRFYKTLWMSVFEMSDEVRQGILNSQRDAFWQGLLEQAMDAGDLSNDMDAALLVRQLDFIQRSALHGWATGDIAQDMLNPTVVCGFALMLGGVATPASRAALRARLLDSQAKILDAGKRAKKSG